MYYVCKGININKNFSDYKIFNNLNFEIKKGELIALVGKSGSGKSTLLNVIGGIETFDSGNLELFEKKVPKINSKNSEIMLREKISYIFQNFGLIDNETIDYNLEIPLLYSKINKKEKKERKEAVLKKLNLKMPLTKKIYELSGGEQQRVAIARILLKPTELILADEPTGSLDLENRDYILNVLKELNSTGTTILIATHDQFIANSCDRIINL